ncbi:MAG: TauD/TfdA family dioxygenase, partial [Gammaproteobacteria bacterium]|nr:TauD/TfdA family dioxygenase [Gammaproteobacteria bacterium]
HRFGEQPEGEPPVTRARIPIFSVTEGVPCVVYIRGYIDLAEEEGYCTLSPPEREALDLFDAISNRPDVRLDFTLERGEIAFFNNCLLLHTRTAFEDHPEPERRRHLLRLWLMEDGRPAAQGVRMHKGNGGIAPKQGKGTYYSGRRAS